MTLPAALLGATVRVLRTAGGRRVLQLALLVGGLFTLGFLCGEQAHAADGFPVPAKVTSIAAPVHGAGERVVPPVRRIGAQAVAPVRDVMTTVSRSLKDAPGARAVGKPRSSAPSPHLPPLTQEPDDGTAAPAAPAPPAPQPQAMAPRPQRYGGAAAPGRIEYHHRARAQARGADGAPAQVAPHGPQVAPHGPQTAPVPRRAAHTPAYDGIAAVGAPGCPAPSGDPAGVLGKQAADGAASRPGDAHAITLDHRAPLWLGPCATAYAEAPRTRERHRDIPVFPG
ncbi:hypothetical protein GCM10010260_15290 [Streptomyces filipinensis]|uniref:Uncharacterized protein n=1 Tax=Streptomyces filipinensis TaxID=66887 RepID=A0A918I9I1_9ACTN|nr:hypothetical protein [Streptomyces filipinensis]GGU83497.1 hypothetical protein GCM10010260_15290 [Streptomyces filipinensis]